MTGESALRDQLARFLDWDSAHMRFDDAVKDFPPQNRGIRPSGTPHSAVEFSRDAKHVSPPWPSGYWPSTPAPPTDQSWDESIAGFRESLRVLEAMANDGSNDLFARIPHGDGQTLLREILLAGDHNAHHLGQLVMVRKMLA